MFIADRSCPAYVLLSIEDYRRITNSKNSIVDALAMDAVENIDFDPPRLSDDFYKKLELS